MFSDSLVPDTVFGLIFKDNHCIYIHLENLTVLGGHVVLCPGGRRKRRKKKRRKWKRRRKSRR
jgi:hypothetical protein